jgi:hypothetical protein
VFILSPWIIQGHEQEYCAKGCRLAWLAFWLPPDGPWQIFCVNASLSRGLRSRYRRPFAISARSSARICSAVSPPIPRGEECPD